MPNTSQESNKLGEKSAAALAFATMLSEQLMPKKMPEEASPEVPQTQEMAPDEDMVMEDEEVILEDEEETQDEDIMEDHMVEMEKRMDEKLESFKEEILDAIQNEEKSDK